MVSSTVLHTHEMEHNSTFNVQRSTFNFAERLSSDLLFLLSALFCVTVHTISLFEDCISYGYSHPEPAIVLLERLGVDPGVARGWWVLALGSRGPAFDRICKLGRRDLAELIGW